MFYIKLINFFQKIETSPSDIKYPFFFRKKIHKARIRVGCSGKSQHRLLPPSFPPTSSLSTPYSLTSNLLSISLFLITFFSLFTNQVSCFPVSLLNLPSPSPISMPRHHRKIHTYQQIMVERDPLKTTIPPNSNGIASQVTVETTCSRPLVYLLNRCRDRFPAIPPNDTREETQGPCNRHDRHDRPNIWVFGLWSQYFDSKTFYVILDTSGPFSYMGRGGRGSISTPRHQLLALSRWRDFQPSSQTSSIRQGKPMREKKFG
jgi:hypothetical protein